MIARARQVVVAHSPFRMVLNQDSRQLAGTATAVPVSCSSVEFPQCWLLAGGRLSPPSAFHPPHLPLWLQVRHWRGACTHQLPLRAAIPPNPQALWDLALQGCVYLPPSGSHCNYGSCLLERPPWCIIQVIQDFGCHPAFLVLVFFFFFPHPLQQD